MATLDSSSLEPQATSDERFFLRTAIAMAAIVALGFSFQLAMGRSTFASPVRVHIHAVLFMGWMAIYVLQNVLISTGRIDMHRRLGWFAAAWMVAMIVSGNFVIWMMVRSGTVPFFFQPLHFLVFDPMTLFAFAGLTIAAIALRRRNDWHRRLHFCGMAMLIAPAFGRLLPLPLIQPWGWELTFLLTLLFPLLGVRSDLRGQGAVHPAWAWGVGAMLTSFVLIEAITYSPVGLALYDAVTQGSPGAALPPLETQPPPEGPLMTGRA